MGRLSTTDCTYLPTSSHKSEAVVPWTSGSNTPGGERYSTRLGSPRSYRPKEGSCGPTHGKMWGHPPTWDTWTGWPRHCLPKHLLERLNRHLT